MATVKGDVHDIGKNIVGVVLQCNGYEVIDIGVMVSCAKILETAKREGVDVIGLSGLITPSLDEMASSPARWSGRASRFRCSSAGATTQGAHRAADRAEVQRAGGARARRLARGGRGAALLSDERQENTSPRCRRLRARHPRGARRAAGKRATAAPIAGARRQGGHRLVGVPVPVPASPARARSTVSARGAGATASTGRRSSRRGSWRDTTPPSSTTRWWATASSLYADARALLDRIVREELLEARAVVRLLAGQLASATTSSSTPTTRVAQTRARASTPCGSSCRSSRAGPTSRWPTTSPRATAAWSTTSARSR